MRGPYPWVPLAELLTVDTRFVATPDARMYPKLSVRLYGRGVTLDPPVDGSLLVMKRHQLARAGQVILSEIWGKKGAIGLVPPEGEGALCTTHFFLFDIREDRLDPSWLQAIFTANLLELQLGAGARGTTDYAAVRPRTLLGCEIPLPPLPEQRRLIAQIEDVATKTAAARSLRDAIGHDQRRLLLAAFSAVADAAPRREMRDVAPLVRRPVDIDLESQYHELGIRSFGKGTFHKPAILGVDVGSKRLFEIHPGDLLFSNVFAWEGAVAVATPHDGGRYGSHRFITCSPRPSVATSPFLCFYFLTDAGLRQLGDASPGGAGRNRTLGLSALEKIQVPVPTIERQIWFDELTGKMNAVAALQSEAAAGTDAILPSVLGRAFKGEL